MFIESMEIEVDVSIVSSACLVKALMSDVNDNSKLLESLGFEKRFIKICKETYERRDGEEREKESDILELADRMGDLMMDNEIRPGYSITAALYILKKKLLKDSGNIYLEEFDEFINISINYEKAFSLLSEATEGKMKNAHKLLGEMYEKGLGRPINLKKALECYQKAKKLGCENMNESISRIKAQSHTI